MTRKLAIAAFAASLAACPMLVSEAEAQNARRSNNHLAIGIAAGVGGLLIGSAIANAQSRQYVDHRYGGHSGFGYGRPRFDHQPRYITHVSQRAPRYRDDQECFLRPIQRVDRFTGEVFTVGTRFVCR